MKTSRWRCIALALAWWLGAGTVQAQLLAPGPLAKSHAALEGDGQCQRCHASGARVAEPRCLDCHSDIGAQQRKSVGLHGTAFRSRACGSCHVEHLGKEASLIRWPGSDKTRFDHAQTGFTLRGAHAESQCGACHDKRNARGAATFLGLEPRCASCHEDPHARRFGERCNDCHSESSFSKLDLGTFDHGLARFALEGAHRRVACVDCHHSPPRYKDLAFADCSSCHLDPHAGRLEAPCKSCHVADSFQRVVMPRAQHPGLSLAGGHQSTACASCHDAGASVPPSAGKECVSCHAAVHEAPFGERCVECHASVRWVGLPDGLGRRVHSKTSFPLRGAHGDVDCAECHLPTLARAERYRSLQYETCASCHIDAHRGSLREHGDCAACHDPIGFAPSLVSLPQHASFGFPLEGAHAATSCGACHEHSTARRTDWTKRGAACSDCHKNPHGTQFALEMSDGGCAHCHNPKGWGLPSFDHASWPLTGAHANALCSACHTPTEGDRRVGKGASYRGLPRTCEGCHDDVHAGQFRSAQPVRSCTYCHQTDKFALTAFDHAKLASYLLEGKHRETSCKSCHPSVHLRSGEEVTRWRLGYNKCADCHADPHTVPGAAR